MEKNSKIEEIRSDEVQEILSQVPNWMIQWGITVIFGLLILVLFISWFIKYPDVVEGQLTLTSKIPPSILVSQTNGYISGIYKENGAELEEGEFIASIKSPAKKSSLDTLILLIHEINFEDEKFFIEDLQQINDLGGLQETVNSLISDLLELSNLKNNKFYFQSLETLEHQIEYQNSMAQITKQELALLQIELSNAKEKFEADSSLFAESVISKQAFYTNQTEYFQIRQEEINAKRNYVQNKIALNALLAQRNEMQKDRSDLQRQLESRIDGGEKSIKTFKQNWQQNLSFTAPQSGKLSFLSSLSVNDYVKVNQELFAVIPKGEHIIGLVKVTNQAFGKVEKGQKVRMRFANYPVQEFGQVIGKVVEISNIPSEEGYFLEVKLTNGLVTTFNKSINYQPNMLGTAEIVTNDLRLIERVFNSFRQLFDDTIN